MDDDFKNAWAILEPAINYILTRWEEGFTVYNYTQWYQQCHNLCSGPNFSYAICTDDQDQNACKKLYLGVKAQLLHHLESFRQINLELYEYELLNKYLDFWSNYQQTSKTLNNVLMSLNNSWVKYENDESRPTLKIDKLAAFIWQKELFDPLNEKLIGATLEIIQNQRKGLIVDLNLLKLLVDNLVCLGMDKNNPNNPSLELYKSAFEDKFIPSTKEFYQNASHMFKQNAMNDYIPSYLAKVLSWIENETLILETSLHPSTKQRLMETIDQVLIIDWKLEIYDFFVNLQNTDQDEELIRNYGCAFLVLSRIPDTLSPIQSVFRNHVSSYAIKSLSNLAVGDMQTIKPKEYFTFLFSIYKKFEVVLKSSFQSNYGFQEAFDRACQDFVNKNPITGNAVTKSPEIIASYTDSVLQKNSGLGKEDLEIALSNIVLIFKYISDKDVFQKFYSKKLAKRLVNGLSIGEDEEAFMLTKLTSSCGFEYTAKLQRMIADMAISDDLNRIFREKAVDLHYEFSALVLGSSSWPLTLQSSRLVLNPQMTRGYEKFQNFYIHKHSGRKLHWLFHVSKGEIVTKYLEKTYTLQVSTYQMTILLLFNQRSSLDLSYIENCTKIQKDIVLAHLQTLLKSKLLLPAPKDSYVLNMAFKSKKIRINLNVAVRTETAQEVNETLRTVKEDRQFILQAAIVRIMKGRKTIKHVSLVQEVLAQVSFRFKPEISDIKLCIDSLIEKEYLERMTGQRDTYSYIA